MRCPGHQRHWFTIYAGADGGGPGARSPKCVRCGAPNPTPLTTDDWWNLVINHPHLLDDPDAIREQLESQP